MMHDDELVVTHAIAQSLIAAQFPEWANDDVVLVTGSGTDNLIYRIGTRFAARFPRRPADPASALQRIHKEASAMNEMTEVSPFPCPRSVAIGEPGEGYPLAWSVQTWLPGDTATPQGLANSQAFAGDLVALILALRSSDTRGRHFEGDGRGGTLTDHDSWMRHCFSQSERFMDVSPLHAMWIRLRTLQKPAVEVMNHRDLIPANILVEHGRLIGVLDTGGFAAADPALDLVAGWHLPDVARRQTLRTELGCDIDEWRRGAAWALQQAMGLVWYYRTSNPEISALGASTLDRLLADPEI